MNNQKDKILEVFINEMALKILSEEIKVEYNSKELDFLTGRDISKSKTKVLTMNNSLTFTKIK